MLEWAQENFSGFQHFQGFSYHSSPASGARSLSLNLAAGSSVPFSQLDLPTNLTHDGRSRITVLNILAVNSLEGITPKNLRAIPFCQVKTPVAANTGYFAVVGSWVVALLRVLYYSRPKYCSQNMDV